MSQPYIKPSIAGITMSFGGGTQQPIYDGVLSYQADAQKYADAIGANLINAAAAPSLGVVFGGTHLDDAAQPWVVQWNNVGPWFFAGIAINQEVAAQGGNIGGDGTWEKQANGVWLFKLKPPVVAPPAPTPAPLTADAEVWAMNVMNAGQGYLSGDRVTLLDTHRLLVALAAKQGIV